jgi:hypothetical protein
MPGMIGPKGPALEYGLVSLMAEIKETVV